MPNSATLVQALLAAFCAILCTLSSFGGGGIIIAANYVIDKARFNLP